MRRIEEEAARLQSRYRDGARAKITALSAAVETLDSGDVDAPAAIRRIARQLRSAGATHGLSEVAQAAALAESADPAHLAQATRALIEVLERTSHPEAQPAEILLVEDSPVIIDLLARALASPACIIHSAKSARQARELLSERIFDLVILDLILPDEDGRNLLVFMQDRVATAAIPVIVLSARGGTQTKTECLALGAEQYFEKPFDKVFLSAVAGTIHRQRRHKAESREDLLTGLPNRAAFREAFERTVAQCRKNQRPMALAMLDLDHFDAVGSTYGEALADDLLRRMGHFLYGELRHMDVIARWGSDEFVVAFASQTAERSALALRRIQETLRLQDGLALQDGRRVHIAFSAGMVEIGATEDLDSALARADQLLYLAKTTGRDRVLDSIPEAAGQTRARILLAEADPLIATLMAELLGEQGFDVTWCDSGESALATALGASCQMAILDRNLPGMDSFELLGRLRQKPAYQDAPILVLTTMGSEPDIERAFELGADDYMQKPFRQRELIARIRRLLKRAGVHHEAAANPGSPEPGPGGSVGPDAQPGELG